MTDAADPTAWTTIARRFADPAYRPDWTPADRPPWPYGPSPAFRAWIAARLEELAPLPIPGGRRGEGLLAEERAVAVEPSMPELATVVLAALRRIDLSRVTARYQERQRLMTRGGQRDDLNRVSTDDQAERGPTIDDVERAFLRDAEARDTGAKRSGPTRGVAADGAGLVKQASRDLWLVRKVIVPRFWPERALEQVHLPAGELGGIIALRYSAIMEASKARKLSKAAERLYKDSRMASL